MFLKKRLNSMIALTFGAILNVTTLAAAIPPATNCGCNDTEPTNPIHIMFDSKGIQTYINNSQSIHSPDLATNSRLATILSALSNYGQKFTNNKGTDLSFPKYIITYTGTNEITDSLLADQDVYISLTRPPNPTNETNSELSSITTNAYTSNELNALEKFVRIGGKSILLHANHGPNAVTTNSNHYDDFTFHNKALAERFNIKLHPYIVYSMISRTNPAGYMTMNVLTKSKCEELQFLSNEVRIIASHDSCIIVPPTNSISIAKFPKDAWIAQYEGTKTNLPPQPLNKSTNSKHNDFAVLVHAGKGNVIVIGNSGMIADYGSPMPAPGLVTIHNNLMFFLNCVSYLSGVVNIPKPGQLPGDPGHQIP
jgi:hypothetical protein